MDFFFTRRVRVRRLRPFGLGERRQAVGGARGVGDHGVGALVVRVVHAHHIHGHIILFLLRERPHTPGFGWESYPSPQRTFQGLVG